MGRECVDSRRYKNQKVHSKGVCMQYVFYAKGYQLFQGTNSPCRKALVRSFRGFNKSSSDSFPSTEKWRLSVCGASMVPKLSRYVLTPIPITSAHLRPHLGFRLHRIRGSQKRRGVPKCRTKAIMGRRGALDHVQGGIC